MCHVTVPHTKFYQFLLRVDQDVAQQAREQGCRCGGVLHSARYPRKPRGIERPARAYCDFRYSFCCAQCRRRTTPVCVRFLGRRVYVGAILVLVSATRASAGTAAAMRQLAGLGVPPWTIHRWRQWWTSEFIDTAFWTLARAAFVPQIDTARLPASLLERFSPNATQALFDLLRWLCPLSQRGQASN